MLHSVFERAQRDRGSPSTPAPTPSPPKVVKKKARTLTPGEYVAIVAALPAQHRLMVETAINTASGGASSSPSSPATSTSSSAR